MNWRRVFTLIVFSVILFPPAILFHQVYELRRTVTALEHSLALTRADVMRLVLRVEEAETALDKTPRFIGTMPLTFHMET